jgi:hypothetical protein
MAYECTLLMFSLNVMCVCVGHDVQGWFLGAMAYELTFIMCH